MEASLQSSTFLGNFGPDEPETESGNPHSHVEGDAVSMSMSANAFSLEQKQWLEFAKPLIEDGHGLPEKTLERQLHHVCSALECAFNVWNAEASQSCELFAVAHEARQSQDFGRNLSLVCIPLPGEGGDSDPEACLLHARFIHWQDHGKYGRPIELDSHHRVKALVCVGKLREALHLEPFSAQHTIVPDVGVAMQRARGYRFVERPVMPANMLRLQLMCSTALQAQQETSESISATLELEPNVSCCLCRQNLPDTEVTRRIHGLGQGSLFRCACCVQFLSSSGNDGATELDCVHCFCILANTRIHSNGPTGEFKTHRPP